MSFGRLERTTGKEPISDINVTPMVDVMLVLVVILLITAPLLAGSIALDLPKAESAVPSAAARSVRIDMDAAGQIFFDDQPSTLDAVSKLLAQRAQRDRDTEVQLRADAKVPYGKVVEVIGMAQKAGLSRIAFAAQPPQSSQP
jgi:biopolymer transport protein TolR